MVRFKELGTNSDLVANILVKNTRADIVEDWMEWCTVAFRTVVVLCCHTSTILAYGCTSSVFCYRDLELRDFIQQRSLSFVALPGFFINELVGNLFESLWTFQRPEAKKGQALPVHRTQDSLLLFQICFGPCVVRYQSTVTPCLPFMIFSLFLHGTQDFICSALRLHTLLLELINVAIFLYCFLTQETRRYLFCQSVPTNPVQINVSLN